MTVSTIEIPTEFINESGEIIYPDSDGKPMADNTKQFEWIATIKGNLDSVFANRQDVFVAGDLLWYPVEGLPQIRVAPDIMVALGRPKGHRGSYQQWKEGNITPQVVFEILSPGNTATEMLKKWRFYNKYGVKEYYLYDPDENELYVWTRTNNDLIDQITDPEWNSPLLGVKFVVEKDTLKIYDREGKPFLTYVERVEAERKAIEALDIEKQAKQLALDEIERLRFLLQQKGLDPD
jgi:Uma2 family endonuclease